MADPPTGELTDTESEQVDDAHWPAEALKYLDRPCNGISGILTEVKTRTPRNRRASPTTVLPAQRQAGPLYRLADYLEQHGRRHRADHMPPVAFWTAAARYAHPSDLRALGDAAQARGLYRDAAQLYKHATTHGDPYAPLDLIAHMHALQPVDDRPVHWAARHTTLDHSDAVLRLLKTLKELKAENQVTTLAERVAAHSPPLPTRTMWSRC